MLSGIRIATLLRPPVTISEIISFLFKIKVNLPGIYCFTSCLDRSSTSAIFSSSEISETATERGLLKGRFLILNTFFIAVTLKISAPRPYNVSVG